MIIENLSTLKIHKLSQEQHDRELEAGRIDKNALYLTPEDETTPEDIIEWMSEENSIIPVASSSGEVYTTNDGKILIL